MSQPDTDRNLLFGVLALQADLLDAARFAEACTAWSARKDTPLADLLVERGWLSPEDRADVERRLDRKLRKHAGDVRASLTAATTPEIKPALTDLVDPEIHQTLDSPDPARPAAADSGGAAQPRSREGYTVRRLHAGGGLAQIWLAHDADLGRDVALKEMRPERAASPALVARFFQEAQITGQLEHPGIVPIYELVRRPAEGPPFYTMRFVNGHTLKEAGRAYHARREAGRAGPLELRELLNAFVAVCNAVAYAHSRGVLHRDLKGDNVVLGDFGEVVVLDWGLAKVLSSAGSTPDAATAPGEAGRDDGPAPPQPAFADPAAGEATTLAEGVRVEGGAAGTVAGQIMGTPAYMAPEQAAGQHDRVGPRSDVYGLGAVLYEILTGRPPFHGSDTHEVLRRVRAEEPAPPRQLVAQTPPALEAVCLRALAKEPADRYESAAALADEVRRWLADEPVTAYREPWSVRTRRWLGRHRTLVASTGAALLVAVIGLSLLVALLGAANQRERRANDDLNAANQRERQATEQARANFHLARDTVERYCVKMSEDLRLRQEDLRPLRKELLQTAAEFLEQLKDRPGTEADVRRERGRALQQLGFVTEEIGSPEEAIRHYTEARTVWADLAGAPSAVPDDQSQLAAAAYHLGRLYSRTGRLPQAEETLRQALDMQRQLAESSPDVARHRAGQASTLNSLALLYQKTEQNQKAEEAHRQALALRQKLCDDSPGVVEYQRGLAQTYDNLAAFYRNQGPPRWAEAEDAFAKALDLHRRIVAEQPGVARHQHELAICYGNLGILHLYKKERPKAEQCYQQAVDLYRQLIVSNPSVVEYRSALAGTLHNLGNLFRYTDRLDRAEETYKESLAIRKKLVEMQPSVPGHQMNLGRSYNNLGILLEQTGRPGPARECYQLAVGAQKPLVAAHGTVPVYRGDLVRSYRNLGESYRQADDFAGAEAAYKEAAALDRAAIDSRSGTDFVVELADDYNHLARLMNQKRDAAAALAWADRAVAVLEPALDKISDKNDARLVLSGAYAHRAQALTLQEKYAEALRAWDRVLELAPEKNRAAYRVRRAGVLARSGQYARAAAETDGMVGKGKPSGVVLYNAACVQALAAEAARRDASLTPAEQDRRGAGYASRAMDLLLRARRAGFFKDKANVGRLKSDSDLKTLRDRAEFKRLVSELEATT